MKKNWLLIIGIVVLALVAILIVSSASKDQTQSTAKRTTPNNQSTPPHNHAGDASGAKTVPAYFEVAPSKSSLGPTLDPAKFTGPTREAYRAVKEIPVTIAQLPCYCYCDQGFGHKSLYSCFEDDHAAHCAVCVNEALLALKLEKEQKLTPAQIRETIVKQYAH
ncbi:MAG TPA: CYCXC family (seleno)protein [Pyrinomonadaceae bacterium]